MSLSHWDVCVRRGFQVSAVPLHQYDHPSDDLLTGPTSNSAYEGLDVADPNARLRGSSPRFLRFRSEISVAHPCLTQRYDRLGVLLLDIDPGGFGLRLLMLKLVFDPSHLVTRSS